MPAALTLVRPSPCTQSVLRGNSADGWLVVARWLDDRDGPAGAPTEPSVRAAIAAIATGLKRCGLAPERVLVLVKEMARGVLDARQAPLTATEYAARISRLVGWTIDGYYADA